MTKQFYAYIHARPDGTPFYVGKGFGKRAHTMRQRRQWHENIVSKHGAENILVGVYPCSTEAFAFELEVGLIKTLRRMGHELVNLTSGGEGATGRKHRPESIEKMRRVQKGKVISPEAREKMAAAKRGVKRSSEACAKRLMYRPTAATVEKIRIANTGKKRTPEQIAKMLGNRKDFAHTDATKAKMRMAHLGVGLGRTVSIETRAKLSAANKGRVVSPEARAKISAAQVGRVVSPETVAKRAATCKSRPMSSEKKASMAAAQVAAWVRRKSQRSTEYGQPV